MTALTLAGAVVVGLTLGLFGGGGSILTVPLLVYVAGIPATSAIAMSLFVVGVTSVVSAAGHARAGRIRWRTGLVTGLVGAGGGFLVVPALVLLGGMPMSTAVATSLVVIAMKSFAGLAGYLQTVPVDWSIALPVTAAAVVGGLLGGWLAGRVHADRLRTGFGWFVLVMGGFVLIQQAPPTLFHTAWGVAVSLACAAAASAGIAYLLLCRGRHGDGGALRAGELHRT
ncbi:sulfite exporter TauE/SafE family protein [Microbispora sp. NPDC046973]|uniref:sulfite exporter TauE/SafE family protein n=1 Tax=Microbispora sp. NPDC046973 TaxID=3155022 RepID=UPI00340DB5F6